MSDEASNGTHLVPPRLDRRAMAKMRGKLAASGRMDKNAGLPRLARPKRSLRIWPFVIALALALGGMHFALRAQGGKLSGTGALRSNGVIRLEPPPGLSLDEQTRFWCYAVYDYPKLKARFKLPKGTLPDKQAAQANLDRLLAEDLGAAIRNEVFVYQQARASTIAAKAPKAKAPAKK
jgi:hypothetical protein